jgi:cytochrome c oxidase subunit 4
MAHPHATGDATAAVAHEHHFPEKAGQYVRIGIILVVLTALEVGAYEVAHRAHGTALGAVWFIPTILALSALKFALVALYYMHLKWDGRLLKGVFSFSLFVAAIVILALMALMFYHYAFNATLPKVT